MTDFSLINIILKFKGIIYLIGSFHHCCLEFLILCLEGAVPSDHLIHLSYSSIYHLFIRASHSLAIKALS